MMALCYDDLCTGGLVGVTFNEANSAPGSDISAASGRHPPVKTARYSAPAKRAGRSPPAPAREENLVPGGFALR